MLTSVPVGHPAFINFTRRVELGTMTQELEHADLNAHAWQVVEMPTLLMARSRRRMRTMQQEYADLHSRKDRIKYLRQVSIISYYYYYYLYFVLLIHRQTIT